jgi:hypothetical protein
LHADLQTRNIIAECPAREVSSQTAEKYRRAYELVTSSGKTALEYASTRAHWDFLRTACRYCLETDIKKWRKASEYSRKHGDIESAQRRTDRAWRLAVVLDEQFLKAYRETWATKAVSMKALGVKPVSKSKRNTRAPSPNMAVVALADTSHRGTKLLERHATRLAVLSLTGCRPAELMKGVEIETRKKDEKTAVLVTIQGAKVDGNRGQAVRTLTFFAQGSAALGLASLCAEHGGKFSLETTDADCRSLNRALKKHDLSCYSFRHQVASELKSNIAQGQTTPEKAAQVMGQRSTRSLTYYGTRSHARGGRRFAVGATSMARVVPVTYAERAQARTAKKAKAGAKAGIGATPKIQPTIATPRVPASPQPPSSQPIPATIKSQPTPAQGLRP